MRKEKLRRHWMDRPPLPASPVPCDGVVHTLRGQTTYEECKKWCEKQMASYDEMSRETRDFIKDMR